MEFEEEYFTSGDIGYKDYGDKPHFRSRAQWIIDYYDFSGLTGKVYILGCAYGYVIKHMIDLGFDDSKIIGIESSAWAFNQATQEELNGYIVFTDIDNYNWATVTNDDLIISWNVMDCMPDEIKTESIISKLNSTGALQAHIVCIDDDSVTSQGYKDIGYFIKTLKYWQDLLTVTGTVLIDYHAKIVYQRANPVKWNVIEGDFIPLSWGLVTD